MMWQWIKNRWSLATGTWLNSTQHCHYIDPMHGRCQGTVRWRVTVQGYEYRCSRGHAWMGAE